MNNMLHCKDLVSCLEENKGLEVLCASLSTIWAELGSDRQSVEIRKQEIQESLVKLIHEELVKIESNDKFKLRKHRVLKVRAEIKDFWSKCQFSTEQQEEFKPFHSELYTDALLEVHKSELQRLGDYYRDNEKLFDVMDKYMKLYEHNLFLTNQNKNPNRLFENRGAQLLKDERDRIAARKDLPKYEKKIAIMTSKFATKYGRKFTINGKTVEENLSARKAKIAEDIAELKLNNEEDVKNRAAHAHGGSILKRKVLTESKSSVRKALFNKHD